MSELKPCPFCGGEASVNDDPTGNGGKPHMSGNVGLGRLWSVECDECGADAGFWQDRNVAIAAWNSRAAKPCYAADANYERCKYGVNRGWCDDAPFLVWDDTGHLFITMGGLKTWDVTDDARKWSAAHGTLTAEQVREAIKANAYPETSTTFEFGSSSWQEIADELNSRAERTCKQEERGWGTEGDHARVWLTCGHDCMVPTVQDLPNYCPNCGARVVS